MACSFCLILFHRFFDLFLVCMCYQIFRSEPISFANLEWEKIYCYWGFFSTKMYFVPVLTFLNHTLYFTVKSFLVFTKTKIVQGLQRLIARSRSVIICHQQDPYKPSHWTHMFFQSPILRLFLLNLFLTTYSYKNFISAFLGRSDHGLITVSSFIESDLILHDTLFGTRILPNGTSMNSVPIRQQIQVRGSNWN